MAEVVQIRLEELIPVFEQLEHCKLIETKELNVLINRCKRYEYRLQKSTKNFEDFTLYTEFLLEFLNMIGLRRKSANYDFKRLEIEGQLNRKINRVFNNLTERFKGNVEHFHQHIKFLKNNKMYSELSSTYSKLLRFHGDVAAYHLEAAQWEFFENGSVENARGILQLAIRKFPQNIEIWFNLFHIEVEYVKLIFKRKDFLLNKTEAPESSTVQPQEIESVTDDVLKFKLAEVVVDEAGANLMSNMLIGEFLFKCWLLLSANPMDKTKDLEGVVFAKLTNEYASIAKAKSDNASKDILEIFDDVIEEDKSENMCRIFLKFADAAYQNSDTFALMKKGDIYRKMFEMGFMKADDYVNLVKLSENEDLPLELEWSSEMIRQTINHVKNSKKLWEKFLSVLIEEGKNSSLDQLNSYVIECFQKMDLINYEDLCRLYFTFLKQNYKDNFGEVIINLTKKLNAEISGHFKVFYVEYLVNNNDIQTVEKTINELLRTLPNSINFYLKTANLVWDKFNTAAETILEKIYSNGVNEHGNISDDLWICYLRFCYRSKPTEIATVYQRAGQVLEPCFMTVFLAKYTALKQETQ
uniref:U3 small nucleolar RNA-associated protein 6-like protein n=1 Tax=Rhabditophanes sp. KR3021 TaxID=114890 RepID=A0AC35UFW8_9BILA